MGGSEKNDSWRWKEEEGIYLNKHAQLMNQQGQRAINQCSVDRAKYKHHDILYLDYLLWAEYFFYLSTSL